MNRDSYNAIAEQWDASRTSFRNREREFVDALLDGLPVPSEILDLGCGTGRPIAEYLLAQGHRVTGVDQSAALLEKARSRFPQATGVLDVTRSSFTQATWIECRIEDFDADDEGYHAVIAWDSLFHIERTHHETLFRRIAGWLVPGGRFMTTFGGSENPAFTDTMFGETFFYDSHPPETALALLAAAGFEPILSEFLDLPTGGRDKGRYGVVMRRV